MIVVGQESRFASWAFEAFEEAMMEAASELRASPEHRALREAAELRSQIKSPRIKARGPERL